MPDVPITEAAYNLAVTCIGTWSGKNPNAADDQYWEGGQWVAGLPLPSPLPAYRQGGPALACAAAHIYDAGHNPWLQSICEQTIDWALSPTGRAAIGYGTDALETMMFAQDLGTVIVLLDGLVAPAKMTVWKAALREGADRVLQDITWYANGNINLGYALVVYLAWRALGDAKYDWRRVLQLAKTPPPRSGGTGYGLTVDATPSWVTGTDGVAFFAEQKLPGWPVGYDGEYTMVQLDVLTRLAMLTGDADVALLASQLLNKTLERTDVATWTVDCGKGTRHTADAWDRLLLCPTLHVLHDLGQRAFPADVRASHWARVGQEFRTDAILLRPNVNFYKGLGGWVGLVIVQTLIERGLVGKIA